MDRMNSFFYTSKCAIIKLICLIIFFTSCTEKINVGVEDAPPMLVVDAEFTSEAKVQTIKLHTTSNFFQYEDPAPIIDATVKITDEADTFTLTENLEHRGNYETSDIFAVEGKVYHLLISNVDVDKDGTMEEYTATEKIYPTLRMDSIQVLYHKSRNRNRSDSWRIRMFAQEPEPIGNCYIIKARKNRVMLTDSLDKYRVIYDYPYNGKYLDSVGIYNINKRVNDSVNINDTIVIEYGGISLAYANFISDQQRLYRGTNPLFGGPSANVWGNIKPLGKAIGYFAVYPVFKKTRIYKGEEEKDQY
jgi:hypothetical protein